LRLPKAIAHLQDHGLVHRDIKPSNVIFVSRQPRLADIGLATDIGSSQSFVGTENGTFDPGAWRSIHMPGFPDGTLPAVAAQLSILAPFAMSRPDGESYVRATADGRLKYARTADGVTLRTFYHCHPRSVAFSPDGQLLACASTSNGRPGRLKVWKLADGALLCQMDTAVGDNSPLCFSPDGHVLASTGPGSRLNLWQLPQGKLKWSATLPRDITRIVFADQGRAVVAICTDGSVTRIPVP
jgi:WD40 repeat protein